MQSLETTKSNDLLKNMDGFKQPANQTKRLLSVLLSVRHYIIDNLE